MRRVPTARVILDSVSPDGVRITTFECVMHRYVLAEVNTHRAFTRCSASSRAIPVERQLQRFIDEAAYPVSWPREQPGMQGGDELTGPDFDDAFDLLHAIRNSTAELIAGYLSRHPDKSTRLHKSVLNRPLEWGQWHTALITSTEWDNFFAQRCSPLAQPEFRVLAEAMRDALAASTPTPIDYDDWHTPLIQPDENDLSWDHLIAVSAARCARVSYLNHDGVRSVADDLDLFVRLMDADPPHWSPLEHVARPYHQVPWARVEAAHNLASEYMHADPSGALVCAPEDYPKFVEVLYRAVWQYEPPRPGNFAGWAQLRHDPLWRESAYLEAVAGRSS